jgi:hypothetical protein
VLAPRMIRFYPAIRSRRKKFIAYSILAIIFGTIAFGIFVNLEDIDVWLFNSPSKPAEIPLAIDYPPQNPGIVNVNNIILHIDISLTSANHDDVLAEGAPVSVDAIGFSYFQTETNSSYYIGAVLIGFEGAYSYNSTNHVTKENASIEIFNKTAVQPVNETLTPYSLPEIYWPNEGSYYPVITMDFFNNSNYLVKTITQAYPNHVIYIAPIWVLQDERYNRIYVMLTVSLLVSASLIGFITVRGKLRKSHVENF